MKNYQILQGNSLDVLKTLPDQSVDTCVTSPPYYALRDYGTAKWVGGDPECPHRRMSKYSEKTLTGHAQKELAGNVGDAIYKTVCPLCGAVRVDEQIGLEETPEEYIQKLVEVFHEVFRVLKDDGTLWINIGDSYNGIGRGRDSNGEAHFSERSKLQSSNAGSAQGFIHKTVISSCKPKDLIGIPWLLAFALRNDGWYLRQDIIWAKQNCMPESVKDRCTKSHEYIFLLTKNPQYYFDSDAIKEPVSMVSLKRSEYGWNTDSPTSGKDGIHTEKMGNRFVSEDGRNKRDVWSVPVNNGYKTADGAHYATFPQKLITPCVLAGSKMGGVVLDPFNGSGTTGEVALSNGRNYIGIELNPLYCNISEERLKPICSQQTIYDLITDDIEGQLEWRKNY